MKPSLRSTLILLFLLSACSPEEPAPASTLSAASPTPLPSPIEPTATKESPPAPEHGKNDRGVIVLRQEGGFAGVENEWTIHEDGRVVTNSGDELQVKSEGDPNIPQALTEALAAVQELIVTASE